MREIAAASDFDFVASEPAPVKRKPRARAAQPAARAIRAPLWVSRLWAWRTPLFGGLAFVTLLTAIAVNAMFLQHGKHPAPLMGSVLRIEAPTPPAPAVARAAPAPSAMHEDARADAAAPRRCGRGRPRAAAPLPTARAKPAEHAARPAQAADPIGALMDRSNPAVPAKTVAAAQKALNKLGLHVPANGHFDAATRKAVEKFQRDNGLPVTGELTPKLRRYLALQAGLPAELTARLRSDIWVSAYLRRCAVEGAAADLRRRGAAEAGAIFIKIDRLDGVARAVPPRRRARRARARSPVRPRPRGRLDRPGGRRSAAGARAEI